METYRHGNIPKMLERGYREEKHGAVEENKSLKRSLRELKKIQN